MLGDAAGCVDVGVRRIEIPAGGWSTPAHEHGREEEIFYMLAGRGISWHRGRTTVPYFVDRAPIQFVREAELGPPELPDEPGPRPKTVANVDDVEPDRVQRGRVARARRRLSRAAGSETTGLQHVVVEPGKESGPQHCHSVEEEVFVILDGDGVLVLDQDEIPVSRGHVVARPAGTGVSHMFRAGEGGLTYLAYGTRDRADVCYYPRSNKIAFRGVGLIARLEGLDYWDGED
jgi:uncharacterized cupin superfamily protein